MGLEHFERANVTGTFRARGTRKQHGKSRAGSRERRDHTEHICGSVWTFEQNAETNAG